MTQQNPDTEAIHEIDGQSTLKPIIDSMREARDDRAIRTLICKFPSPAEFAKVGASSIYLYVTHKLKEMHLEDQVDIEVQCEPCKPDGPLNRATIRLGVDGEFIETEFSFETYIRNGRPHYDAAHMGRFMKECCVSMVEMISAKHGVSGGDDDFTISNAIH